MVFTVDRLMLPVVPELFMTDRENAYSMTKLPTQSRAFLTKCSPVQLIFGLIMEASGMKLRMEQCTIGASVEITVRAGSCIYTNG